MRKCRESDAWRRSKSCGRSGRQGCGEYLVVSVGHNEMARSPGQLRTRGRDSPFSPTLFLLKLSMASWKSPSPAAVSPDTLYCSHSTGTFKPSKISLTESVISFPIPSPGMSVTVYLPEHQYSPDHTLSSMLRTSVLGRQLYVSSRHKTVNRVGSHSPSSRQ
jgi:hypothetical protein